MTGIAQLVEKLSSGYMAAQALTILLLYVLGLFFVLAAWGKSPEHGQENSAGEDIAWKALLAFPAGLSLFSVSAYLLLCLGIPYNAYSVGAVMAAVFVISVAVIVKNASLIYIKSTKKYWILLIISLIAATAIAIMSTANVFDVVLDNDSFFYFSAYPETIVREGAYIKYFDVFLTDAAPIGSIVQTLPYLFGFSETFGIQCFLDLNFVLIFAYALYEELIKVLSEKEAVICTLAVSLFLVTSSAYQTTAKWVMAGVYFMSWYFITAYLGYRFSFMDRKPYLLTVLFTVSTAMMRHEGVILIIILMLSLSFLKGYSGREFFGTMVCPVMLAAAMYYIRVFFILDVHPLYAFLSTAKALIMIGMLLLCGLYFILIRDRLGEKTKKLLPVLFPALMLFVNAAVMIARPGAYLGNLKMFYLNVRIGAGWGYFGYIAGFVVIVLILKALLYKEWYLGFFTSLMISYVLGVLLAAFGRGDSLRKGVGDSGNRVMLTAVPLIVFALALRFFSEREAYDKKS